MDNKPLYPELGYYIFMYCGNVFWGNRPLGKKYLDKMVNSENGVNIAMYKILTQGGNLLKNPFISELTNDGFESYKIRISERIFNEHKDELKLNLCPMCNKIARTPWAKQCRFCRHDWH